jgi:hypothetical protein
LGQSEIDARRRKVWADQILYGNHGLAFWSQFARRHGKSLGIPEWGVNNRVDRKEQHSGLDNAYFIEQMHRFITDPTNNVVFHCYFDVKAPDGHHQLSPGASGTEKTEFPQATARFKKLFGARPGVSHSRSWPALSCCSPCRLLRRRQRRETHLPQPSLQPW